MTARPDQPHIGLIVEGPGDKQGVPILLRRYLAALDDYRDILGKPIPCKGRGAATREGGIEGFVGAAAARPGCRGVLVVLDAETDAACRRGPELLARAERVSRVPVAVCLAEKHFEEWIYSSAETLDLGIAYKQEGSALAALKSGLHPQKYVKTIWQPRLAGRIDTGLAATRNSSLARMLRKIDELLVQLKE